MPKKLTNKTTNVWMHVVFLFAIQIHLTNVFPSRFQLTLNLVVLNIFKEISKYLHFYHFSGLVQERSNSIANAMELHLSCTNPWISQCLPCGSVWKAAQTLSNGRPRLHLDNTMVFSAILFRPYCATMIALHLRCDTPLTKTKSI